MISTAACALLVFIGTNTPPNGASRGLYAVRLDARSGAFGPVELAAETHDPGFLAWHPNEKILYALGQGPGLDGKLSGGAVAFSLERATEKLTRLNAAGAGGAGTTHLATDATGRALVVVSYGGGTVASFPLGPDGALQPRASLHAPTGPLGPMPTRQEKPHPHSVTLSPDNRFAYVCDLGLDAILVYALDAATATLTPAGQFATAPGAGPRHSKISDDGRFLYALNELSATIETFSRDLSSGALARVQTIATLPDDFEDPNTSAEIRLHPNGRFLYASNRGHDSIAVFSRDAATGRLSLLEHVPSGGGHPRNFALSPAGDWLVCANRDSDNLVSFRVDSVTGRLIATGHSARVPQAICVLFAR
ncbi:MAG: 3-carboxymuconate cyclase [Opitutus sp.]|nr:3-carboxymuconate cyclase [Opitutus sp.]